ncbi:MAG: MGMT family protein [Dermatophilaceae bacterium]
MPRMHGPLTPVGPLTLVRATYGQIAGRLGVSVGSARAVGAANGAP